MVASRKPLTLLSRRLRRDSTDAEQRLWRSLRAEPFKSHHFRRQVPLGPYIADFASHSAKLVIELDGGQHGAPDEATRDASRTAEIEGVGYRVIRFWNSDVFDGFEGVLDTIAATLYDARNSCGGASVTPAPDPSPQGGGE